MCVSILSHLKHCVQGLSIYNELIGSVLYSNVSSNYNKTHANQVSFSLGIGYVKIKGVLDLTPLLHNVKSILD